MRARLLEITLCFTLVAGCGGDGSECRSSEDCRGTLECAGPNDAHGCGIGPTENCGTDIDCGDGLRCHAVPDSCSQDGVGSECDIPCTEAACGAGFRCGATGACEVVPCDEGYACQSYQMCDPSVAMTGPVHSRAHGCLAITCSEDDACPSEGACVNGVCQEGPGSCVEPQLVP